MADQDFPEQVAAIVAAVHADAAEREMDPYRAVEVLFRCRHQLPPDILRSLAGIWCCASAAKYGEPYEPFWEDFAEAYGGHLTPECEDENDHPDRSPWAMIERFCEETGRATVYGSDFDAARDTEEFQAWLWEQPTGRAAEWNGIRFRYGRCSDQDLINIAIWHIR